MFSVYLFALIGLIVFIIAELDGGWDWDDIGIAIPVIMVSALIGLIIGFCLPAIYTTEKWKVPLMNLQDHSSISGSFFLGCGQINGQMEYVFYTMEEDSTYRMWEVPYYDAKVKYVSGTPQEAITKVSQSNTFYNKFVICLSPDNYSYVLEVPTGTIKTDFTLDAI